jgi:hypothetical protein
MTNLLAGWLKSEHSRRNSSARIGASNHMGCDWHKKNPQIFSKVTFLVSGGNFFLRELGSVFNRLDDRGFESWQGKEIFLLCKMFRLRMRVAMPLPSLYAFLAGTGDNFTCPFNCRLKPENIVFPVIIIIIMCVSLVTGLSFPVRLLNQQWSPPLRLQASLQNFPYYVWCSKYSCLL